MEEMKQVVDDVTKKCFCFQWWAEELNELYGSKWLHVRSDCYKETIDANDDIHVMHDEDIMREIRNLRTWGYCGHLNRR